LEIVPVPSTLFVDQTPSEAVAQARELAAQGRDDAWEALDRHLRWHVIRWIQDRPEAVEELRRALLNAYHWAARAERAPWGKHWSYLLEILRDAEQQPALAADLEAVGSAEGRAAELLAVLARQAKPLRPSDLSEEMRITIQQVSNLGRKLEEASLIIRRAGSGKATWFVLTPRGVRLAEILKTATPSPAEQADSGDLAPELTLWNGRALEQPVSLAS
jgi:DNA-binding MarR family transcriptional regulator